MKSLADQGPDRRVADDDPAHVDTRRLTRAYVIALALVALLTIAGQLIVQRSLYLLKDDTAVVNLAGRQRMLSQRIARLLLAPAAATPNTETAKLRQTQLAESLTQWRASHRLFSDPNSNSGALVASSARASQSLAELNPAFEELAALVESWLQANDKSHSLGPTQQARVVWLSDEFLAGMDRVVKYLDDDSARRVSRVRWIEFALMLATLVILAIEGWLIFKPAVTQLRHNLHQQHALRQQLIVSKEQAERANLAKTEFLARVSHELRTPLHAISGMLELVRNSRLSKEQRQRLSLASQSSLQLRRLVDDLLDVSTAESGGAWQLRSRPVDIARLVRRTVKLLQPLAKRKGITLVCAVDRTPLISLIDPFRLQQVLVNLLQNGITYTEQGQVNCSLRVEPGPAEGMLVMEVSDTGCGIAAADQSRIFDAFVRLQDRKMAVGSGAQLGLGLPIAAALTRSMGGEITLKSELGGGSTFAIRLPLIACAPPADKPNRHDSKRVARGQPQQPAPPGVSSTASPLLIVDDTVENREVLKGYAELAGRACVVTESEEAAQQLLAAHGCSTALVDYHLSTGKSLSLLRWLTLQSCKTYLITADTNVRLESLPDDVHVERVLHKPLDYETFCRLFGAVHHTHSTQVDTEAASTDQFAELRLKLQTNFMQQLPKELTRMREAIEARCTADMHLIAHRLRGSAATVGFPDLAERFAQLESLRNEWPEIESNYSQILDNMPDKYRSELEH